MTGILNYKSQMNSHRCNDCTLPSCDDCHRCGSCLADECLFKKSMGEDLASAFCMTLDKKDLSRHAQMELPLGGEGTLYIVRSGAIMIHVMFSDGRRNVLDFRYAGELFYSSLKNRNHVTSLQAIDETKLLIITEETLSEMTGEFPMLGHQLMIIAASQIESSSTHNLILNRLTAEEKIASFLYNLAVRTGQSLVDRTVFMLPMNRTDIADFLGLNAETVSRVISKMKKRGVICLPSPGEAYVEDMNALASLTPVASVIGGREMNGQEAL